MSLPYDFYPVVLKAIGLISQGLTETRACDESGLNVIVFRRYIKNNETLQEQYEEALQRGYDAMAEALLNPFDTDKTYGESDTAKAALISANLKWFLSKRANRIYGDKVEHTVTITADRAITQALERAKARSQGGVIDVTPTLIETSVSVVAAQTDEEIMAELGLSRIA